MPMHKGGKKARKLGRNMAKCKLYRDRGRRELNKERDLLKHIARFPLDLNAPKALDRLNSKRLGALR